MKKVLLVVCMVALVSLVAAGAYASDATWLINIKAINPTTAGGGAAAVVGVGTSAEANQSWPTTVGSTAAAERTGSDVAYHSKHDVLRDADPLTEAYSWDLKIGARLDYVPETINIAIWNTRTAVAGNGGEINHNLAYAFWKGETLLAWFSDAGAVQAKALAFKSGLTLDKWNDVAVIGKNAMTWSPTSANMGFFVQDTVQRSATGSFDDLASYRFEAFYAPEVPEPGSLMALGTGLIGLAGFATRRRK